MITVRVSSCTGGNFPAPLEAAEYREACKVTGISAPAAFVGCEPWAPSLATPGVAVASERASFAVLGISKILAAPHAGRLAKRRGTMPILRLRSDRRNSTSVLPPLIWQLLTEALLADPLRKKWVSVGILW